MYSKILVPVDGSPTSDRGLDEALKLAGLANARLMLLHVVDLTSLYLAPEMASAATADTVRLLREAGQTILARAKARAEAAGRPAETTLVDGLVRVCDEIVKTATDWGAELVVIGTHGRRGVRRLLLGSDAEQVLRLSPVPVLLVRADDPAD